MRIQYIYIYIYIYLGHLGFPIHGPYREASPFSSQCFTEDVLVRWAFPWKQNGKPTVKLDALRDEKGKSYIDFLRICGSHVPT